MNFVKSFYTKVRSEQGGGETPWTDKECEIARWVSSRLVRAAVTGMPTLSLFDKSSPSFTVRSVVIVVVVLVVVIVQESSRLSATVFPIVSASGCVLLWQRRPFQIIIIIIIIITIIIIMIINTTTTHPERYLRFVTLNQYNAPPSPCPIITNFNLTPIRGRWYLFSDRPGTPRRRVYAPRQIIVLKLY